MADRSMNLQPSNHLQNAFMKANLQPSPAIYVMAGSEGNREGKHLHAKPWPRIAWNKQPSECDILTRCPLKMVGPPQGCKASGWRLSHPQFALLMVGGDKAERFLFRLLGRGIMQTVSAVRSTRPQIRPNFPQIRTIKH